MVRMMPIWCSSESLTFWAWPWVASTSWSRAASCRASTSLGSRAFTARCLGRYRTNTRISSTAKPATAAASHGSLTAVASCLKSGIAKPLPPPRFFFAPGRRLISIMERASGVPQGEADRQHQQRYDLVDGKGLEDAILHADVLDRIGLLHLDAQLVGEHIAEAGNPRAAARGVDLGHAGAAAAAGL